MTTTLKTCCLPLVLFSTCLLNSCEKKTTEPDVSQMRLFTKQTEITDAAVKARFLSRAPLLFRDTPSSANNDVRFITADTAVFGSAPISYSVVRNNNQYLFYSPQTVVLLSEDALIHSMLKYVAPKLPLATQTNYDSYLTKEVRVGYGSTKRMQLPYLQYYWIRRFGRSSGILFNELNEGVIADVTAYDTLAVRVGIMRVAVQ